MSFESVLNELNNFMESSKKESDLYARLAIMRSKKNVKIGYKYEIDSIVREFKNRNLCLKDDHKIFFEKLILIGDNIRWKGVCAMSAGDIFSLMEVYNDNATFNGERSTFIPLLSIDPYIVGVFDNDAILYQMIKDDNIAESVYKSLPDFFNCLLALILSKNDDEFMDGLKLTEHNKKIIEQNGLIDKYIEKGVNFRKVY